MTLAPHVGDALARFQRGEAGEGQTAKALARADLPAVDDDFRAIIHRFVREEGRHARILKGMLGALDRPPARRDWAVDGFRSVRRRSSLPFDVMWLATAEIVGLCTYHEVADALPPSWARSLRHVAADEALHLTFFLEFARRSFREQPGHRLALPGLCAGAQVVNLASNHRAFSALGVDRRRLIARSWRLARWAQRQLGLDVELAPKLPCGLT